MGKSELKKRIKKKKKKRKNLLDLFNFLAFLAFVLGEAKDLFRAAFEFPFMLAFDELYLSPLKAMKAAICLEFRDADCFAGHINRLPNMMAFREWLDWRDSRHPGHIVQGYPLPGAEVIGHLRYGEFCSSHPELIKLFENY